MTNFTNFLSRFARDEAGTFAIETVLVMPLLVLMSLGIYEVSSIVSRQQELQSAASEAEMIILSASNSSGVESDDLKTIIKSSVGLTDEQLTLVAQWRCNDEEAKETDPTECDVSEPISEYVQLTITDTYTPIWTTYGVGSAFNYTVVRTVQVS